MRPLKQHIFNEGNEPLCFEGKAIEFDTFEEAESFVLLFEEDIKEIEGEYGPIIKEGILYYDGGYCHYPEEVNLNV